MLPSVATCVCTAAPLWCGLRCISRAEVRCSFIGHSFTSKAAAQGRGPAAVTIEVWNGQAKWELVGRRKERLTMKGFLCVLVILSHLTLTNVFKKMQA